MTAEIFNHLVAIKNNIDFLFKQYRSMNEKNIRDRIEKMRNIQSADLADERRIEIDPLEILLGEGLVIEVTEGHFGEGPERRPQHFYFDNCNYIEL